MVEPAHGAKRVLYWILSGFFFMLAMVGVVLPGLPTTPFLLLMCYFLLRVSPTLHAKAMTWPVVGGPLRDWQDQGGVRPNVKCLAYAMVTILVGSTLIFSSLPIVVKTLILAAAIYGISVVARLPVARSDQAARDDRTSTEHAPLAD
ncbi:YbaN family protein [Allorhodopirellula solitaria]|uniref:Inner membrane protein YbaN n=1 Tax=Allorhodopirellula solitaria TaxID=2527987 RepID=A0A5C5WN46_9BACT|nr:YbaN family protein [Allorhodopirellula solitaria]TWT52256.1 Inner membrane protein YbaN [Allorhodopirellula solitaria]